MEYYLCHHGIVGMKWGVRRYQNADGSLTAAGRKRYNSVDKYYNADDRRKRAEETYLNKSQKSFGFTTDKDIERARTKYVSEDKKANKELKKYRKQIQKDIAEAQREDFKSGADHQNYKEVRNKLDDALNSSKEHQKMLKAFDKYNKLSDDVNWKLHEKGLTTESLKDSKRLDKAYSDYQKAKNNDIRKGNEIIESFRGDILGAKLKDLGHKDTEVGRQVLNDIIKKDDMWWTEYYKYHK